MRPGDTFVKGSAPSASLWRSQSTQTTTGKKGKQRGKAGKGKGKAGGSDNDGGDIHDATYFGQIANYRWATSIDTEYSTTS